MKKIPIDFVAGSHGHYLETVCNQEFGIVKKENNFTASGTSHVKSATYQTNKVFDANHWFELYPTELSKYPVVVSIQFTKDDLLLLSSVSLLRAGDANIDNDLLEEDTVNKLLKSYYQNPRVQIKNISNLPNNVYYLNNGYLNGLPQEGGNYILKLLVLRNNSYENVSVLLKVISNEKQKQNYTSADANHE